MKKITRLSYDAISGYRCDKCQKEATYEEDPMEFQEFISISHPCGPMTPHDGSTAEIDLCFDCAETLLGPFWNIKDH